MKKSTTPHTHTAKVKMGKQEWTMIRVFPEKPDKGRIAKAIVRALQR